jgi:hypothetical protein
VDNAALGRLFCVGGGWGGGGGGGCGCVVGGGGGGGGGVSAWAQYHGISMNPNGERETERVPDEPSEMEWLASWIHSLTVR